MTKNNLMAAIFLALAVAAPFLLFWLFSSSANSPENRDSEYVGLAFVFWLISSIFIGVPLLALAAICWEPGGSLRTLRVLLMTLLGGGSLLVGVVMFGFAVTATNNLSQLLFAGIPGLLALGAGCWALYELMLPISRVIRIGGARRRRN